MHGTIKYPGNCWYQLLVKVIFWVKPYPSLGVVAKGKRRAEIIACTLLHRNQKIFYYDV